MKAHAGGHAWCKSTFSDSGNGCVEVAIGEELILVRDTKDREGPVLRFTRREWAAFLNGAKHGEFDLSE